MYTDKDDKTYCD